MTKSQQQVLEIIKRKGLQFVKWADTVDTKGKTIFRVEFLCPKCHRITNRRVWEMIHSCDECSYCGKGHRRLKDTAFFKEEVQNKYSDEYEVLDEYVNAKTKLRVRHSHCGFIFEIAPDNLLQGKGCPRCNRYNSKGSKAIKKWLTEHNFEFETEKKFDWSDMKRYDFYIPSLNLLIEFNGEQHYRPIEFFLRSRNFEEQQVADRFKEEQARLHGYKFLVIRYDELQQISEILSNSTTIS